MKLCRAILAGFRDQLRIDDIWTRGEVGMCQAIIDESANASHSEGEVNDIENSVKQLCLSNGSVLEIDNGLGPFYDDLTKQLLPTDLVRAARRKELEPSSAVWLCV